MDAADMSPLDPEGQKRPGEFGNGGDDDDHHYGHSSAGRKRRCCGGYMSPRTRLCIIVLGTLVVLSVIVGVAVGVTKKKKTGSGANGGPTPSSPSTSSSDSSTPATTDLFDDLTAQERFRAIKDRIVLSAATDESALQSVPSGGLATPQFAAADWLASKDPMKLSPDDPHLMDRYALAVLWYATHESMLRSIGTSEMANAASSNQNNDDDDGWTSQTNWMTGKGLCSWHGVRCLHDGTTPTSTVDELSHNGTGGDAAFGTSYDGNGKVTVLDLSSNDVRGPIPDELIRILTSTKHLNLNENSITGTIPNHFREWRDVEHVFLSHNFLEGPFPDTLTSEWHGKTLKSLNLGRNWLEGTLPEHVGNLKSLYRLSLFENKFTGKIPPTIGKLHALQHLFLDYNELTGTVPETMYELKSLSDMRINDNKLEGTVSDRIGRLTKLKILAMDNNNFGGTIPDVVIDLVDLEELTLYGNNLDGTLPNSIGRLDNLRTLYLDRNRLSGPIPKEWTSDSALRNLQHLILMDNDLTGTLPNGMADWVNMVDMRLNGNQFTGTLPPELSKMKYLEHLALENNKLTGTVSAEWGALNNLEELKIHLNDLTGTVPKLVCDLMTSRSLKLFSSDCDEGDYGEDPEITCDCCSMCFESRASPPPPNHKSRDRPVGGDRGQDMLVTGGFRRL